MKTKGELQRENEQLKYELAHMKKAGACHACEAVGEENLKLRELLVELIDIKEIPVSNSLKLRKLNTRLTEIKQLLNKGGE